MNRRSEEKKTKTNLIPFAENMEKITEIFFAHNEMRDAAEEYTPSLQYNVLRCTVSPVARSSHQQASSLFSILIRECKKNDTNQRRGHDVCCRLIVCYADKRTASRTKESPSPDPDTRNNFMEQQTYE